MLLWPAKTELPRGPPRPRSSGTRCSAAITLADLEGPNSPAVSVSGSNITVQLQTIAGTIISTAAQVGRRVAPFLKTDIAEEKDPGGHKNWTSRRTDMFISLGAGIGAYATLASLA